MIDVITRNFGWKVFALLIAVLLWIAVANEPELSAFVTVPVEFRDLPDTLEISSDVVTQVALELSGPSGELRSFTGSRTAVVLNMADTQPGERTYTIGPHDVHLPRGLTLTGSIPSQLHFVFERLRERKVPVEARFTAPPERYVVTPPALTIAGPEGPVNRIQAAWTDQIDTRNLDTHGTFHVSAFVEDAHVRIEASPEVTVEVWMKK